jgi:hypothetical protein
MIASFGKRHYAVLRLLSLLLLLCEAVSAQSGRGAMHGYIAFEGVSFNDVAKGAIRAKIELRANSKGNHGVYRAETNEHGSYDLASIPMGEYRLRISSPGFRDYQTDIYIPSDFLCNLATMMKTARAGERTSHKPRD